jgi:hypothetical protein
VLVMISSVLVAGVGSGSILQGYVVECGKRVENCSVKTITAHCCRTH